MNFTERDCAKSRIPPTIRKDASEKTQSHLIKHTHVTRTIFICAVCTHTIHTHDLHNMTPRRPVQPLQVDLCHEPKSETDLL